MTARRSLAVAAPRSLAATAPRSLAVAALVGLLAGGNARASDVPGAMVVLEAPNRTFPADVPEAAPPRFVLLESGQVFVGGSSRLLAAQLTPKELKDLDKRLADVRKLPGLAGSVTVGSGELRQRLLLRKGRPLDMTLVGDPAQPVAAFRLLADLVQDLAAFEHPGLRPYAPPFYALFAREGRLPGGCRRWPFPEPPSASVFAPRMIAATEVVDWPTGVRPASVCADDKAYIVTLRPLLPGEKP